MYAFQSSFHVELICDTYDTLSPFFSNPAQCRRTSITIWVAGYIHRSCQIGSCVSVSCYIYCPLVSLPLCLIYQRSARWDYIITNITTTLTFTLSQSPASCSQFVSCHVLCRKSWLWPGVEPGSPRESVPVS